MVNMFWALKVPLGPDAIRDPPTNINPKPITLPLGNGLSI